ncbi:MAG: polyribonucleotide nucleotidyltransferase [Chloroflexota bacterium]|jgi:polyribonucleotide nucleotidyltransferase|nr:MAG: polyribonucleotide nucleotidyltransferase [Chloroflexota bacterium]|tara:strand:- start:14879 stop:17116 length:2238 start_codon:yes stop_codon:yes gene_type:complete
MLSNYELTIANKTLSVETGKLAKKANGSATLRYGDSIILVTATESAARPGLDFFPLTIDFEERMYARGKIPGSFFKREGRPSTDAILICRLTDRPLRPLFPKGFRNEVQIITTPLSADLENPLDILSINGASLALTISDIPFDGPLGATRMGYIDGDFVINPTFEQIAESSLDLIVAGTRDGVMMMESGANQLDEDLVYDAIVKAQEENLKLVEFQEKIAADIGKEKTEFVPPQPTEGIGDEVSAIIGDRLQKAVEHSISPEKDTSQIDALKIEATEKLVDKYESAEIGNVIENLTDEIYRSKMMDGVRPDGRGPLDLRPLSAEVGIVPRAHGTGLFERGETQALGVVTLGSLGDVQKIDNINPASTKRFLLHYNFPPYSVGEVGRVGSPKRREIGHGALAERALTAVLPGEEDCPYTIRVVTEIMSSNGSTSMASVCSSSLALMDAGVAIESPVAGISIGLITDESEKWLTLTDIQGKEDHIGDMDFKVAGTKRGVTAIQLDMKVKGISFDVVRSALDQAKEARIQILKVMEDAISEPRAEVSDYAPRIIKITIPVDKIGAVIGSGGKTIRGIQEATGATVDIQDNGEILIGAVDGEASAKAVQMIEDLTKDAEVGQIYTGKVVKILDFGAFVEILPGKDGMVHISELANYRVPSVEDVVSLGDEITVIVKDVDPGGRISLSRKALLTDEDNSSEGQSQEKPDSNDEGFSERDRSRGRRDQGYNRSRGRNPRGGNRGQSRRRHD